MTQLTTNWQWYYDIGQHASIDGFKLWAWEGGNWSVAKKMETCNHLAEGSCGTADDAKIAALAALVEIQRKEKCNEPTGN